MDSKNGETVEKNGEKSSEREKAPGILGTHTDMGTPIRTLVVVL